MTVGTADPRRFLPAIPADRMFFILSRATALILIVVTLSLLTPHFLTWPNLINVLRQASLQFLLSAGLTLVVLTGGIDLSIGAVLGLAACVGASFLVGGDIALGVLTALGVGLACGLANGAMVAYVRIPSFIATYGMLWIAHGLGYVFMKGEVFHGMPAGFRYIGAGFLGPLPVPIILMVVVLVILHVMLHRTRLGRGIYAIGGNPTAARLSGMPVKPFLVATYGLSGLLAGFAALVVVARINAADSGIGEELLLPAIAAVCLGGTSLMGGVGGIVGTMVGSIILALVVNGMNLLGVRTLWQAFAMGAIILLSVLADQVMGGKVGRSR